MSEPTMSDTGTQHEVGLSPGGQNENSGWENAAFPPKLDYDNENQFFGEKKNWDSKTVVRALQNGLHPDMIWNKEDLVSSTIVHEYDERFWKHWNTPFHLAVRASDHDSAEIIIHYGGDANIYNDLGHTALHEAIDHRQRDDVWFLIRHGADPDKPSRDGHVPLHLALRDGDEELFFFLLEHGASLQAAAYSEWSIADLALLASERGTLTRLMLNEHTLLPTPMLNHPEPCHQPQPSNFATAAGRLLAVSLSELLYPPRDLYETYQFLLHSLRLPRHLSWDAEAVENLIENFTAELYRTSNIPNLAAAERFCPACVTFQSVAAQSCRSDMTNIERSSELIEIHKNKAELEECALAGCPLCALVAEWLYDKSDRPLTYTEFDGEWAFRLVADESCPESSPITLEIHATLTAPSGELPRRVDSVYARLADVESTVVEPTFFSFDLKGLDVRFGTPQDDSSHIDNTGSSYALGIADQWLKNCRTSPAHHRCQEAYRKIGISSSSTSELPTRVLHVGSDHQDPCLFQGNGMKASYCILSYCWGRPGNVITTKANISEHMKGIALAALPNTLREAVLTARALGFDYIWIDALCIIQDDEDDWAREASVMHELYSRADLTITSLVAGDSRDNLFQPRPREVCRPITLNLGHMLPKRERPPFKEGSVVELAVYPPLKLAQRSPMSGPVHQRAWTLQEQAMSTRLLHFGAGLLHWECLRDYLVESYPALDENPLNINSSFHKNRQRKLTTKGLPQLDQASSHNEGPFEVWKAQVQEFTRRQMTKPSDRVPAFLAISKSIGSVLKAEFVGGIWKGDNHLLESLCWRLQHPDTIDPRGPTWTWASRSGEVSYDLVEHRGDKTFNASVISCDAAADRSQSHVSGSITLKGTLTLPQDGFSRAAASPIFDQVSGEDSFCTFDIVTLEIPPARPRTSGRPFAACVLPDPEKGPGTVSLLLQPINVDEDFRTASAFRRVGISFRGRHWSMDKVLRQQLMELLKKYRLLGSALQPVANEDNISAPHSGILNQHVNREVPGPIEGVDQSIPPTVDDKARPEDPSSSSSEGDDCNVVETYQRRKTPEVQTNRVITIF